jgi:hypothetical protein
MEQMCEYYCQKILERHFKFGNANAYSYPLLDPKYLERKRKKYGNQPMLVASGLLRESVTTLYKIYKIRGQFRIVLKIPSYGKYVKEVRDFTLVNSRDMKDMMRFYHNNFAKRRKALISGMNLKRK